MLLLGFAATVLIVSYTAATAANSVPDTRAGMFTQSVTVNDFRPAACTGLILTTLIAGSGNVNGTRDNDLILGTVGARKMDGKQGDDCLVGSATVDEIDGGQGADVCIGPAATKFKNCELILHEG